jgi:hypothetical protein
VGVVWMAGNDAEKKEEADNSILQSKARSNGQKEASGGFKPCDMVSRGKGRKDKVCGVCSCSCDGNLQKYVFLHGSIRWWLWWVRR